MTTDEERREVARRLRGLNDDVWHVRRVYEAEGSSIFCEDQADYYQICDAVAGYLPADYMHPCDYEELHERLADLIEPEPERTARMEYDSVHCDYVCTSCGERYESGMYSKVTDDDGVVMVQMRYCPNCGAKVING